MSLPLHQPGSVLITGASGFVGSHLVRTLNQPIITSRNRDRAQRKFQDQVSDVIEWDPMQGPIPLTSDLNISTVINLMGESVGEGRWTKAKKKRIWDSRVGGTQNLIAGMAKLKQPVSHLVSTSAIGFYDDHGDQEIDEQTQRGTGFLADLAGHWEDAAESATEQGTAVSIIRVGLVLGKDGGLLKKLLPLFRCGLGGRLSAGSQWMSWIEVSDLVNLYLFMAENGHSGIVNGCAPEPVRNRDFTQLLARQLNRTAFFTVPKTLLQLAMGEFAEYVLASQKVIPRRTLDLGFVFRFAKLQNALAELVGKTSLS